MTQRTRQWHRLAVVVDPGYEPRRLKPALRVETRIQRLRGR